MTFIKHDGGRSRKTESTNSIKIRSVNFTSIFLCQIPNELSLSSMSHEYKKINLVKVAQCMYREGNCKILVRKLNVKGRCMYICESVVQDC